MGIKRGTQSLLRLKAGQILTTKVDGCQISMIYWSAVANQDESMLTFKGRGMGVKGLDEL